MLFMLFMLFFQTKAKPSACTGEDLAIPVLRHSFSCDSSAHSYTMCSATIWLVRLYRLRWRMAIEG